MKKRLISMLLAIMIIFISVPPIAYAAKEEMVYISISDDSEFILDKNGKPVANYAVRLKDLKQIDLDDYELGEYKYDADGDDDYEITALQLYIYTHTVILGLDWDDVRISGSSGSIYFEENIFGFSDQNLRYDYNGSYPIDEVLSEEWGYMVGATADHIVLKDNDFLNIAHYSDWSFYGDSATGFHYFADEYNKIKFNYNTAINEEITLKLIRGFSDWSNNGEAAFEAEMDYEVYYGLEYGVAKGSECTNDDGDISISFSSAGTWYIWAEGGYGAEADEAIVSSPAFATVTVKGEYDLIINIDLTEYKGSLSSALVLNTDMDDESNTFLSDDITTGQVNKYYFYSDDYDQYIVDFLFETDNEEIIGWNVNGVEYLIVDAIDNENWELENDVSIGYNFNVGDDGKQTEFYLVLGTEEFDYGIPGTWNIKPVLKVYEEDTSDANKIELVEEKIAAIGNVNIHSGNKIRKAREEYEKLTDEQKANVQNIEILEAAEHLLSELYAEVADTNHLDIYKKTQSYISKLGVPNVGSVGGEWMVINLTRSGNDCPEGYYENVVKYVSENINENEQLHRAKSTDNSRVILALTSAGYDVTNVAGHNLLMGLTDMSYVKKQGINGPIWALIALNSHNYDIPRNENAEEQVSREGLISYILGKQLEDGGWALSGKSADPDMTGMAIQALAPYYKTNENIKESVNKAIDCLSQKQLDNGGFGSIDGTCSESCAQVIVALTSIGINPETDPRFVKNGVSVLDAMCIFAVEGGGFAHLPNGVLNGMATEQSQYALISYYRFLDGKTTLYDMSDVVIRNKNEDNNAKDEEESSENNNESDNSNDDNVNEPESDKENYQDKETNEEENNDRYPETEMNDKAEVTETGDNSNALIYLALIFLSVSILFVAKSFDGVVRRNK